jgi:hypothetical protein
MKWSEFPWWTKALVWYSATLSVGNIILLMLQAPGVVNSPACKVDPGLATLCGAIIGLSIVAYQARVGFKNLIASQENQARLEREAREHQLVLDAAAQKAADDTERKILISALRAELGALEVRAQAYVTWAGVMKIMFEHAEKERFPNSVDKLSHPALTAPVYEANISRIGLLGASLAGDVISVLTKAAAGTDVKLDNPIDNKIVAGFYEGLVLLIGDLRDDLGYVTNRLRKHEMGSPDTAELIYYQQARAEVRAREKKK